MPDTLAAPAATRTTGWKQVSLQGWGRSSLSPCLAARPERLRELHAALDAPEGRTLIAHGGGRSYGDAALNTDGAVVVTGRLDRILAFDPATGELVAEPGVTFRRPARGLPAARLRRPGLAGDLPCDARRRAGE
jgi:decaprenylphospho-beta-D-ribofuranose 2-oxidase